MIYVLTQRIDVLDLLGYYVLALTELEDVLATIDNAQGAVGQPHAHVARMMPTLGIDGFRCLLSILVVTEKDRGNKDQGASVAMSRSNSPMKHVRATHTDLAGILICKVFHFGDVDQLDGITGDGWSDMIGHMITLNC